VRKIKAETKISVIIGIALLISFIAVSLSPKIVKSQGSYIEITNCTNITQPGEYRLIQDIYADVNISKCIDIQANNVILDCQGHIIDGKDYIVEGRYGIYVNGYSNITIKNCRVTTWRSTIYIENSSNDTLENIYEYGVNGIWLSNSNYSILKDIQCSPGDFGIRLSYSNYNTLTNVDCSPGGAGVELRYSFYNNLTNVKSYGSGYGVYMYFSSYNNLTNADFYGNGIDGIYLYGSNANIISTVSISNPDNYGILLDGSNSNIIKDSIIKIDIPYLNAYGISLSSSSNNLIYNNIFNTYKGNAIVSYGQNYWNTTLQPGNNIWNSSLGYIGGNLWTTPDNNGYSDTCVDANYDGFCDQPYYITSDGSNIDYLPLAKYVGQNIPTLSVVFNYNSVDFGTVIPNTIAEAKSINYNVSITTNTNYKVSVNATNWKGAAIIPANTLYFAVNDTLDKLSFATAKQLSNEVQLIATFPSTVTTNYHAFYFRVPIAAIGTYTAIITITYEVA